jgi:hypothetical protein
MFVYKARGFSLVPYTLFSFCFNVCCSPELDLDVIENEEQRDT